MTGDSFKEIESQVISILSESGLSIKQFKSLAAKAERMVKQNHIESPDYTPKQYWGLEIASFAYAVVLETGCSANDAMKFAADWFSKPEGWVELTKNNPFFYSKQVVNRMGEHPKQKRMIRRGVMDVGNLKRANTVNQQLRRLNHYCVLDDRLTGLETKVDEQGREIELLKLSDADKQDDIETLFEQSQILKKSPKEKAMYLAERNFSRKDISERLGVSERTIRRWLN